jgi:hypothetical protein
VYMSSLKHAPSRHVSSIPACMSQRGQPTSGLENPVEPALRLRNLRICQGATNIYIDEGSPGRCYSADKCLGGLEREFTNMLTKCAFRRNSGNGSGRRNYPVAIATVNGNAKDRKHAVRIDPATIPNSMQAPCLKPTICSTKMRVQLGLPRTGSVA